MFAFEVEFEFEFEFGLVLLLAVLAVVMSSMLKVNCILLIVRGQAF